MALLDKEGVIPQHLIEAEERKSDEKPIDLSHDEYDKDLQAWAKENAIPNPYGAETFNWKGHTYHTSYGAGMTNGTFRKKTANERRYYYTDPKDSKKRASEGAWHLYKEDEDVGQDGFTGTYQYESGRQGRAREQTDRQQQVLAACKAGDKNACAILQANMPGFSEEKYKAKEHLNNMATYERKGFASGGLMDDSSRLWKMESQYPEFQKGIASRVSKERVPTQPIEEQYMYSPTQSGYPQGYAEGGSVYDTEGSMLAPEVPLNFNDEMPMVGEPTELGLSPTETEVLAQAMSDYPELEGILNKVSPSMDTEFTGDGEVEGPGTGTSDSINAKLSDGEFVFTAKAVKQLGVDKLRKMMSKAEGDYDESSMKQEYHQMGDEGFAKGGFFDRPTYSHGGDVTEQPVDTQQSEGFGTRLKNALYDFIGGSEGRHTAMYDAHNEEMAAKEQQEYINNYTGPDKNSSYDDEMSPENRALLERGNEAIYPKEEYPERYRTDEENAMFEGRSAIVTPR